MKSIHLSTTKIVLLVAIMLGFAGTSFAQRKPTKVIDNKGTIKQVLDSSSHFIDTAYNGLTKRNDSTIILGGKLVIDTTRIDVNGKVFEIANLISGSGSDSLVVADPTTGELKRISSASLLMNLKVGNGVYKSNDSIKLGGTLTEPTLIKATNTNSLTLANGGVAGGIRVTGLTSGATSDSLLVINPADSSLRYISASTLLRALQANNGVTKLGDTIQLGGNLRKNTAIGTNGNNLSINVGNSASDSLNITGLRSGNTATDSIMVVNGATGKVGKVTVTDLLQSGDTSISATMGILTYLVPGMPANPTKVWVYRNGAKLVGGNILTADYKTLAGSLELVENGYTLATGDVIEVQWVK